MSQKKEGWGKGWGYCNWKGELATLIEETK